MYGIPWLQYGYGYLSILPLLLALNLYRHRETDEPYLWFKILGYYFLCAFAFRFNEIALPAGFLVYVLLFRSSIKINVRIKRKTALFGLLALAIGFVYSVMPDTYRAQKTVDIPVGRSSVYSMDWADLWGKLEETVGPDVTVADFSLSYGTDGTLRDLRLYMQGPVGTHYDVRWAQEQQSCRLTYHEIYRKDPKAAATPIDPRDRNSYLRANVLFKLLGNLSMEELQPTGSYDYFVLAVHPHLYNGEFQAGKDTSYLLSGLTPGAERVLLKEGEKREALSHVNMFMQGMMVGTPEPISGGQGYSISSEPAAVIRYYVDLNS